MATRQSDGSTPGKYPAGQSRPTPQEKVLAERFREADVKAKVTKPRGSDAGIGVEGRKYR